jgi:hypothetical protein
MRKPIPLESEGYNKNRALVAILLVLSISILYVTSSATLFAVEIIDGEEFFKSDGGPLESGTLLTYDISGYENSVQVNYKYLYYSQGNEEDAYIFVEVDGNMVDVNQFNEPVSHDFVDKGNYNEKTLNVGSGDILKLKYKNGDYKIYVTDFFVSEVN